MVSLTTRPVPNCIAVKVTNQNYFFICQITVVIIYRFPNLSNVTAIAITRVIRPNCIKRDAGFLVMCPNRNYQFEFGIVFIQQSEFEITVRKYSKTLMLI